MSREEIEHRRALRAAEAVKARDEQEEKDLEAIDKIEQELGIVLKTMKVGSHKPGLPALIAYKAPAPEYYKRFSQQVRAAGDNKQARGAATDMLGAVCLAYPADESVQKALKEAFPGVVTSIGIAVMTMLEAQKEEEGKG